MLCCPCLHFLIRDKSVDNKRKKSNTFTTNPLLKLSAYDYILFDKQTEKRENESIIRLEETVKQKLYRQWKTKILRAISGENTEGIRVSFEELDFTSNSIIITWVYPILIFL